jgi:CRP/FNR family cyclic AMP-dependent transcriptional regulator
MPDLRASRQATEQRARLSPEDLLRQTRTFAQWSDASIVRLAAAAVEIDYAAGELIAATGEPPTGIWVVRSGLLEVSRVWADGRCMLNDFAEPGQMVAYLSVLDGIGHPFDISARRPSSVVFIPRAVFSACLAEDPAASAAMLRTLSRLFRHQFDKAEMLLLNGTGARVAKALLYLGRSGMRAPDELELRISQDDIATWLAVRRQTVNEEISRLVSQGILARRYGGVIVKDMARLMDAAYQEEPLTEPSRQAYELPPEDLLPASD